MADNPPRWDAPPAMMTGWVLARLDALDLERMDRGDTGTLLADLTPPQTPHPQADARKRGRPPVDRQSLGRLSYLALAAHDVDRIRDLWKQAYGRVHRERDEPVKAEQIAADRWGVTVDQVVTYRARGGNRRADKLIV